MEENYDFEGDFDRWVNRSPEPPDTSAPAPSIESTSARVNYLDGVPDTLAPAPLDFNATGDFGGDDLPQPGEKRRRTVSDASTTQTQTQAVTKRQRTFYATTTVPDTTSYHPASTTTSSSGSSTFVPSPAQFATPPLPLPFPYVSFPFGTGPSNDFAQGPPHAGPITHSHQTAPDATPRLACERDRAQALVHAAPPAQYAAGHHYATAGPSNLASQLNTIPLGSGHTMYPAFYGHNQLQAHVGMGPAPVPAFNGFEAAVMNASSLPPQGIDFSNQSLQHGIGAYHDHIQTPPPALVDSPATAPVHQCTDGCCPKPKRGRGSYRAAAGSATHTHGSAQSGSSASPNGGASTSSSSPGEDKEQELRVPAYDKTITPTQPQGPQHPWKVKCIFCGKGFTVTPRKNKGRTIMRWRMDAALQHFCGRSGRPGCAFWVACGVTSHAQPRQKQKQKREDKAKEKGKVKGKGKKTQVDERVIENVDALGRGIMAVHPEMADSGFDHPQFGDVVRGGLCKWWNGLTAPAKAELTGREVEEYEDEDEEAEKVETGEDEDAEGEKDDEF